VSVPRLDSGRSSVQLPEPTELDGLDAAALVVIIQQAAALQAGAMARLSILPSAKQHVANPDDELLNAKAAAKLLGMSEDWLRRNGEREGLVVRVGRRTVKYSRRKITQYVHRKAGRPA